MPFKALKKIKINKKKKKMNVEGNASKRNHDEEERTIDDDIADIPNPAHQELAELLKNFSEEKFHEALKDRVHETLDKVYNKFDEKEFENFKIEVFDKSFGLDYENSQNIQTNKKK